MAADWRTDLGSFFEPKSIAIVGASKEAGSRTSRLLGMLSSFGFKGDIHLVNPKYSEIGGARCYASVGEIGRPVDLAAILVPATAVAGVVRECVEADVQSGIVMSAGFAEATRTGDGRSLQQELESVCERGRFPLCGPNCFGMINTNEHLVLCPGSIPEQMRPGNLAVISQSGALSIGLVRRMSERRIGISHLVTSGNEAVLGSADYLTHLVEKPQVGVVGIFLEGVRDANRFLAACERARALRKPVVVLKAGRTERGAKAALSHTASLAGSYRAFEGAMRQHAVTIVKSLNEFIESTALFAKIKPEAGFECGPFFVGQSGGSNSLLSDLAEESNLDLPGVPEEVKAKLEAVLPSYATISNPLDTTGAASEKVDLIARCLSVTSQSASVGMVVFVTSSLTGSGDDVTGRIVQEILRYRERIAKPLVVLSETGGNISAETLERLDEFACLQGLELGMAALANYYTYVRRLAKRSGDVHHHDVRRLVGPRSGALPLSEGFALLQSYGIQVARWKLVEGPSKLLQSGDELGYPLVMKPNTAEVLHKSDLGLVLMHISSREQLSSEYEKMQSKLSSCADKSVILQEEVAGGIELSLGSARDDVFGSLIVFGLGGVFIETLKDFATRLPPLDEFDAMEMFDELRGRELLQGKRMGVAADLSGLARLVVNFSHLVYDNRDILSEVDVNPVIVSRERATAVDIRAIPSVPKGPERAPGYVPP